MYGLIRKVLVDEFYRQHAGLMLVGFYLLFGVVETGQLISYQEALLLAGLSSVVGVGVIVVSWLLYALKAYVFITQKLKERKCQFLSVLAAVPIQKQLRIWVYVFTLNMFPVTIYFLALVILGIWYGYYLSVSVLVANWVAIHFFLVWSTLNQFKGRASSQILFKGWRFNLEKRYLSWGVVHLFKEHLITLLVCKIVSLFFFKAILWMFNDVGTDVRLLLTAMLGVVLSHAMTLLSLYKFELKQLSFVKSLPVKSYRTLIWWLFTLFILLLPELIILFLGTDFSISQKLLATGYGLLGVLSLMMVLQLVRFRVEVYLQVLLFYFFVSMWVILGDLYLPLCLFLLSGTVFNFMRWRRKMDLSAEFLD